jgi:dTDP-glucose 4,6-dehydratase
LFAECPAARGATSATLIRYVTDRPGHDRRYAIDFSKASSELGFQPRISLQRGLEDLVNQYLERPDTAFTSREGKDESLLALRI